MAAPKDSPRPNALPDLSGETHHGAVHTQGLSLSIAKRILEQQKIKAVSIFLTWNE